MTPECIDNLMAMPGIDRALVVRASLTAYLQSGTRPKEQTAREYVTTKNILGKSPVWSSKDYSLCLTSAPKEEVWA